MKKNLLFFLFSLLSHASISQTEWEWLNPKPIGNPLSDVEFVSENTGFILSANMVFKTTNLGETWQNHYVVSNAVDFDFNQNTGLIAANSSIIYLSTNKGETWESRNINFAVTSLHTANVISDKELAVAGVNNIFTSNDGGKNWNKLPIPTSNITKIHFFSTEVGLVFTSNGQIYKTTNAGLKWTLTNSVNFTPSNYVQVHFVNEKVGYLSRQHGAILKTTDGGDTWVVLHPSSDLIYSFSFLDENTGFLVGADGIIYSTADGAKTLDWKGFQIGRIYNTSMFGTYFNVSYGLIKIQRVIKMSNFVLTKI